MGQHILSYSDAVSFRDIRGHLGKIPSIVTFYIYGLVVEGDYSRATRRNPGSERGDTVMGQHGQRLNTGTCFSVSSDDK
jgi:hypothetical protein